MNSPEPASVTAARQLAADSRAGRRPVRRRLPERTAGLPAIRSLGRPVAEHPDVTGSAVDPARPAWRLDRAAAAGDAGLDEPSAAESHPPPDETSA